ncbi:conserved hypothetical protein [Candidatus Desulfarcum epimagneticum]|uniref:Uncharacterized protein n=1 Tax=uncultured Desulfobacteraceae bacterium TaxID=218296 RepID=A0A484HJ82_9BACT|nr:conserved hypothetical protein [uncultured Desulfobacteraceae bacterium]
MPDITDAALRRKGLNVLFRELGEVDAVRFLSQISHEPKNYLALQEKLFQGMTVDDIYQNAKTYAGEKRRLSRPGEGR